MSILYRYPQLQLVRELAKTRKTKVYLVGGFLRDHYLGKDGMDLDFAVGKDAVGLARAFARRAKGAFVLLDDEHGSARVVKKQDGAAWTFDFTDLRAKDIRGDLRRRDFTINTFCLDLVKEEDHSPAAAFKDLKARTIRLVASRAFSDDPLRLLRAFSLHAQTGFKIEAKTLALAKKQAHLINASAMERVRDELFKILQSPRAFVTLSAMDKAGLLSRVMPQLAVMYGIKQGGYHHLDVWKHSLEVLRQLEGFAAGPHEQGLKPYLDEEIGGGHARLSLLKLAALLHDIGKPDTRKKEGGRMTFHGHEHVGQRIVRSVAKRLKLSVKERHYLENAVRMHLRPGYLSNFKRPSHKAMFRYMRDTGPEAAAIAVLAIADQRSTRGPLTTAAKAKHHEKICRMVIEEHFKEQSKPKVARLLTGHDLIRTLKLVPSPLFAKILSAVQEAQALGKVTAKAQALALARTISK